MPIRGTSRTHSMIAVDRHLSDTVRAVEKTQRILRRIEENAAADTLTACIYIIERLQKELKENEDG